jgi:hypothetical protein
MDAKMEAERLRKWLRIIGYYPTKRGIESLKRGRGRKDVQEMIIERLDELTSPDLLIVLDMIFTLTSQGQKAKKSGSHAKKSD